MELPTFKRLHGDDDYVRPGKRRAIEEEEGVPFTELLPQELLLQIFRYYFEGRQFSAKSVMLTSRSFYELAVTTISEMRHITFFDSENPAEKVFRERCRNLLSLDCCCLEDLTYGELAPLIANNPGLLDIDLSYCYDLSPEIISTIADNCPDLVSIKYSHREQDEIETEHHLIRLFQRCSSLKSIKFDDMFISDDAILILAENCRGLERINLVNPEIVTDEGIIALSRNCPDLQSVQIYSSDIGDESLNALADNCKKLRCLGISKSYITDVGVSYCYFHCPVLEKISFMENDSLTNFVFFLMDRCASLRALTFDGCEGLIHNWYERLPERYEILDPADTLVD